MGGTFMSLPTDYRDYFVRNLHDALSGHCSKDVGEAVRCAVGMAGEQVHTALEWCKGWAGGSGCLAETRQDWCTWCVM